MDNPNGELSTAYFPFHLDAQTLQIGLAVTVPETLERSLDKTAMVPEIWECSLGLLHACKLFS